MIRKSPPCWGLMKRKNCRLYLYWHSDGTAKERARPEIKDVLTYWPSHEPSPTELMAGNCLGRTGLASCHQPGSHFRLVVVDTIMVGRYASDELAFLGIGLVPSSICILFIVGLLMGTMVKVSNHFGAGRYEECGASWWRSLPIAVLGLLALVICACGETLLTLLGQPSEIAEAGGRVSMIMGFGMPLIAVQVTTGYLKALTFDPA